MIRVIHLRDSPFVGGPEKQILDQCARLDKSRFEPVIVSFASSGANALISAAKTAGIRAETLPDGKLALPSAARELRQLFPDNACVIISSGFKADFTAELACAAQGVAWIAWFHGFTGVSPRVRFYEALDMVSIRGADAVVAVCERAAKELRARRVPRVNAIPNAIDVGRIAAAGTRESARAKLGVMDSELIVGAVSRLSIEKGISYLIDAAAAVLRTYPNARFVIIGDGPMRPALSSQAGRFGVSERITFTGLREDAVELMKAMDVFVLPSLRENMPVALLEAMACGVSVVATDVGGVGEVLRQTAVEPVKPADSEAIADAVIRLLEDPQLRQSCAASLVRRAKDFTFEKQIELMESLIEGVCGITT